MARPERVLTALPPMGPSFARALLPSRTNEACIAPQVAIVDTYRQSLERLAAYSRVCGFTLRDTVPPTWLHTLTFPLHVYLLGLPQSSVKLLGAIHVSNSMTLRRPVGVMEELKLRVHVENLRPHRRGALVDLVGSIRAGDQEVWCGTSTYLASGMTATGDVADTPRIDVTPTPVLARWYLPADLGKRYRAASGDPNPIHTSRVAARAFGFRRPLIHGMWTHARALAALEGRLPESYQASVDFVRPILLPGTVSFASTGTDSGFDAAVTSTDGNKPHLAMRVTRAA